MGQGVASILNCYQTENSANQAKRTIEQSKIEMDFSNQISSASEVSSISEKTADQTEASVASTIKENQDENIQDEIEIPEYTEEIVGEFLGENGQKYEGQWVNGKLHGEGKLTYPNGSFYEGQFKDGSKHGQGCYVWDDSPINEHHDNNKQSFRSRSPVTLFSKKYDQDHFKEYYRHYTGEWKNDQMHGQGYLVYQDGRNYEGQFSNNKIHGHGTFHWPNGKKHEGQWSYGKQNGNGTSTNSKGQTKQGLWLNGKFVKSSSHTESIIETERSIISQQPSSELKKLRMSLYNTNKNNN